MTSAGDVCAVLVTRGDVDLRPIMETLPYPELVVWDNSKREHDRGLFGRYLGILETKAPVIYFQDDDCLVRNHDELLKFYAPGRVVGNFRNDKARHRYYLDTTLLGWGSLFDRNLPFLGWFEYARHYPLDNDFFGSIAHEFVWPVLAPHTMKLLVDIKEGGDVEWLRQDGEDVFGRGNRMSQQPGFYDEIAEALARARMVRDAR